MNQHQLEKLNENHAELFDKKFEHFACPILGKDEKAELCDGHVVSKSLGGSNLTIIQRQDVDRFFGKIERSSRLNRRSADYRMLRI